MVFVLNGTLLERQYKPVLEKVGLKLLKAGLGQGQDISVDNLKKTSQFENFYLP